MKKKISSFARSAEADEEYDAAAAAFFALGAYTFADELYQNGRYFREGVGTLLRSIELDTRIGNNDRARRTAVFLLSNIQPVTAADNEPVVRGLGYEWAADAKLMTGDETASDTYRSAEEQFKHIDRDTELYWGASPEYDSTFLPVKRFLEREGLEYTPDHDINFSGRIEWKISVCERII